MPNGQDPLKDITGQMIWDDLLTQLLQPGFIASLPYESRRYLAVHGEQAWVEWEQKRRAEQAALAAPPTELAFLGGAEPTYKPEAVTAPPEELPFLQKVMEMVKPIWRELPISPFYWKTPEEKGEMQKLEYLEAFAQQQGIEEPRVWAEELMVIPRAEEAGIGAYEPPGREVLRLPPMPAVEVGEELTAGERVVGEWGTFLAATWWIPPALVGWKAAAALPTPAKIAIRTALAPVVGAEKALAMAVRAPLKVTKLVRAKLFKPKFPEIPEPVQYVKELKVHHPERFRAKNDLDAIFIDINQYNLVSREIAENVPAPLMANLTKQGRSIDLFGFREIEAGLYDITVRVPYIVPKVRGASMAINDIMQNPAAYRWVGKEGQQALRFVKAYQSLEKELLQFEKKHGILIKERYYPAGQYHIGRNVVAELDNQGRVLVERQLRRGRLGTKLSAEKERWYPTQTEGIRAGKVYATPEESMHFRIQSAVDRASGLKVKAQYLDALSATPKEMMNVNIRDKWMGLSGNYQDKLYINRVLQKAFKEHPRFITSEMRNAVSRRNPALGKKLVDILEGRVKKPKLEINQLTKQNHQATQVAKTELQKFAPTYHMATAKARQAAFTEGRIWAFPGAQNRIFGDIVNPHNPSEVLMTGREVVTNLNKIFTPAQVGKNLSTASDMARVGVALVAAMDGSWPFIQGPMVLGHDAAMWAQGKVSMVWAKSTFEMFKTMLSPKWFADFQIRHAATYTKAPLLIRAPSEFVSGVGVLERWATSVARIPKVPMAAKLPTAKGLTWLTRQTYGRMGAGFSGAAEASRVLFYETMEKTWVKHGGNLVELQALANQISGAVSLKYLGVGAQRRATESALLFAPSFTRSWLMHLRDLFRGNMKAREVQKAMAGMFASMFTGYIAICAAQGEEPKLNPAPASVGGDGAQFLSKEIKGVNVGAPGWGYSLVRFMANVAAAAATNPESLIKLDMSNPALRFVFSKSSPLVNLARELGTQRDYFGNRLETGGDWVTMLADKVIPIAAQSILEKEPDSDVWTAVGAELLGIRTYPVQPWEKLARMREDLACEYKDTEGDPCLWDELPNMLKDEIRRNNPEFVKLEDEIQEEWALKRGTDTERTVYLLKQELEEEYLDTMKELTSRFLDGQITGKEYRQTVNDTRANRALGKDVLWRLHEIGEPEEATDYEQYMLDEAPIQDRYMHAHYDYWDKLIKAEGAVVDWDRVNKRMDEWVGTIPPYARDYIERYKDNWILDLPPEIQPVVAEMRQDIDYIDKSGYWELLTPEEQRTLGLEPKDFRGEARMRDGKLDAILAFWGYTTTIKSAGAVGLLKEKAQRLGRSYALPVIPID